MLSSSQRYIEFLLRELPALAGRSLPARRWRRHKRVAVLDAALDRLDGAGPGLCLEFGVHRGASITRSARRFPSRHFVGFDSFEGFPDDGRVDWDQDFALDALPAVPANVELVKGWFSDTLPPFLESHPEPIRLIHLDCDIYSSTCDVFRALEAAGRLQPGITICFDDLLNYAGYLWNEMLALHEMLCRTGLGVEWLCVNGGVLSAAETIEHHEKRTYPSWEQLRRDGYRQQAALVLTEAPGWELATTATEEVADLAARFDALTALRQLPR